MRSRARARPVPVRLVRPSGAGAPPRAGAAKRLGEKRGGRRSQKPKVAPLPYPNAPSLSRRGQPACTYGAFFRRRKNRLLQRCAYAICPLRRDVLMASGRRASVRPALRAGSTACGASKQRAGFRLTALPAQVGCDACEVFLCHFLGSYEASFTGSGKPPRELEFHQVNSCIEAG